MKNRPTVIYQDDAILVLNKIPGIYSIPPRPGSTLNHNLLDIFKAYNDELYPVHRLDKDTSGVIVYAKTKESHKHINQQFEDRKVIKTYYSLVKGQLQNEEGVIDQPLLMEASGKSSVSPQGKKSVSAYKLIEKFKSYSWVEVKPQTGRTHQIRAHFKFIGHPLAVDPLYSKKKGLFLSEIKRKYRISKDEKEQALLRRLSLHAAELSFIHPSTNVSVTYTSPLPKDLRAILNQLRKWDS